MSTVEDLEYIRSTTIEYARFHGLAIDHLAEPLPLSLLKPLSENLPTVLGDDAGLHQIEVPPNFSTEERLSVSKETALVLASVSRVFPHTKLVEDLVLGLLDDRRIKDLYLETPLLRTDHETDFREFGMWEEPHMKDGSLPMEPIDDERDEGLAWPSAWADLPGKLIKDLQKDKIEVLKETLLFLQASIKDSWTVEDDRETWERESAYKKNMSFKPITPPLLPLTPAVQPFIPSSPDAELQMLSDPPSLINEDLMEAEKAILEVDTLITPEKENNISSDSKNPNTNPNDMCNSPGDLLTPFSGLSYNETMLRSRHVKPQDLKVEVPLTPPNPISKTVTFSEIIEEMKLNSNYNDGGSERQSSPLDKFFEEAFGASAEAANRRVEQEQLQEADSTMRVKIPLMDFSPPIPPWQELQQMSGPARILEAQKSFISRIKQDYGFSAPWPGVQKLVKDLRWAPFAATTANVSLEETIGTDGDFQPFLTETSDRDVIDSSGLTWKLPGLRILSDTEEEEDDELELGHFNTKEPLDMASLLKKRRLVIQDSAELKRHRSDTWGKDVAGNPRIMSPIIDEYRNLEKMMHVRNKRKRTPKSDDDSSAQDMGKLKKPKDNNVILGGVFSAGAAVENYLQLKGSKKLNLSDSTYFQNPPKPTGKPPTPANQKETTAPEATVKAARKIFPSPTLNPPTSITHFIISSSLIRNRPLFRALTQLYPSAELVERDFTNHNSSAWLYRGSVARSPIASPLASEADLILSSSTGLIITTLQKIKQKPLPGQKKKAEVRERIEKVALRYERLIVLISDQTTTEDTIAPGNGSLDGASCIALSEFSGFCTSLPTQTNIHYVAGDVHKLGEWATAMMIRYGAQGGNEPGALMQEETVWELWYRRLGMNAYAAQAVIMAMTGPEGVDMTTSKAGLFGITGFVEMSREERIQRFELLLGGRRVLERVSDLLEREWS